MEDPNVYINKAEKSVSVGEATCDSNFHIALFTRINCAMDFRKIIDILNQPLKFGDRQQARALQAYQAISLYDENFRRIP